MVSTGISSGITSVKTVTSVTNTAMKNEDVSFNAFMMQSMSGQADVGQENSYSKVEKTVNIKELPKSSKGVERKVSSKAEDKAVKKEKMPKEVESKLQKDVENVVDDIKDKIKEKFDVSDEDIEKALETLGLTMMDLLDESNLTDFVVELTGLDSSIDLLVSEDISAMFNDLLGFVQEVVDMLADEYGITTGELATIVDKLQSNEEITDIEAMVQATLAGDEELPTEEQDVNEGSGTKLSGTEQMSIGVKVQKAESTFRSESGKSETDVMSEEKQTNVDGGKVLSDMAGEVINNFANAINETFAANGLTEQVDSAQVVNQIVENAKFMLNQEVSSVEFVLNPENLGKINLNISVREGVVTASIVAQNEAVREAIESQIVSLKESFNNQGLKVEAVEVTVESQAFEAGTGQSRNEGFSEQRENTKKNSNRTLRLDSLGDLDMEELTDEEKIILDMMEEEGNQVNFKA